MFLNIIIYKDGEIIMDDKEYWANYYSENLDPTNQSSFAEFILPKLTKNKKLIDLGCGNARDSLYFSRNGLNVIAVDQIKEEIDYLNKNYKNDNIIFICDDFTDLENSSHELFDKEFDYIYSRFTFHAINEKKEDKTLDWITDHLKDDSLFLLEARSIKDPMYNEGRKLSKTENFTTHYRRFMQLDKIVSKLESRDLEIIYQIEDKDLAVYKDDNPYVIRLIAKKNR